MNSTPHTYSTLADYPNFTAGHTLKPNGSCSCGRWSLAGSSEASLIKSHQLHTQMVQATAFPATQEEPHVSTFPEAFMNMRDAFVKQALEHPAFQFMTDVEVSQSIENRIWSILQRRITGPRPLKPGDYIGRLEATDAA